MLEPNPLKATDAAIQGGGPAKGDEDYWFGLVDEKVAGVFLDQTPRTLQAKRQRGDGPRFVRLSSRCIKYRRIDLREYVEARLRSSTADDGKQSSMMHAPHMETPATRSTLPGSDSFSQRRSQTAASRERGAND